MNTFESLSPGWCSSSGWRFCHYRRPWRSAGIFAQPY